MTQEWRIDADKAENGWVIRVMARGLHPSTMADVATWIVKDDEDLAGTIAAALVSAKLTPATKKELEAGDRNRLILEEQYRNTFNQQACPGISISDSANPPQNLWERLNNKVFCR